MIHIDATQIAAVISIPLMGFLSFMCVSSGKVLGYVSPVGGTALLLAISLFKGALVLALDHVFSKPASCRVSEFYMLSGGLGCGPVPVAFSYSLMVCGVLNILGAYGRSDR